jgi:hypothetical protein
LVWSERCKESFKRLKDLFTSIPILQRFDPKLPTIVETDASDFAIRAIPSQIENRCLQPITFHSQKIDKAELNNEIHDKEMLAIIFTFKE